MNKNAELLLPLAIAHQAADEYVKGTYFNNDGPSFRGCSVGCSINDATILGLLACKTDNHAELARVLFGGVEQIARLQDAIFEGLPKNLAHAWTPRLLQAVIDAPEDVDYQRAWHRFAHWLLVDPDHGVIKYAAHPESVQRVAALHMRATIEEGVEDSEWTDARDAAASDTAASDAAASYTAIRDTGTTWASIRAAVWAPAEAARAAVWAARAATKASERAAWDAGDAAESAAWAAPEDDVRAEAYERMADKLIELISDKDNHF